MSPKFTSEELNAQLTYLYALERRGIKVGLDHTRELLERCGNPHNNFRSIHIAGTNGKGSTAAICSKILNYAGFQVGLYTSPHLVRFNERIRVNGKPIADVEIADFIFNNRKHFDSIKSTFFEATTAMAFWYFNRENVDVAVVETGLGGRLDSTNVLNPEIAVITPISLDHTDLLGEDIETITFEKAGIFKSGIPVVISPQIKQAENVLIKHAEQKKMDVFSIHPNDIHIERISSNGTNFSFKGSDYTVSLIGEHQAVNASTAIEAVRIFNKNVSNKSVQQGLENTHWPGRMERIHSDLPIYYDVAHNPHGVKTILATLNKLYDKNPVGVIALKEDKEIDHLLRVISGRFHALHALNVSGYRVMPAGNLVSSFNRNSVQNNGSVSIEKTHKILTANAKKGRPGLIFGSHYIAGAVYGEFEISFDIEAV
ncbi:MAG: folylpolyglutamate synthase/dihydrofolate synthase family protein [Candidatus Neomarinimicrobiota bacterium]